MTACSLEEREFCQRSDRRDSASASNPSFVFTTLDPAVLISVLMSLTADRAYCVRRFCPTISTSKGAVSVRRRSSTDGSAAKEELLFDIRTFYSQQTLSGNAHELMLCIYVQ